MMDYSFDYAKTNKMDLDSDYKYTSGKGQVGKCKSDQYTGVFNTVGYETITPECD
jgi:hypothetical protein